MGKFVISQAKNGVKFNLKAANSYVYNKNTCLFRADGIK